VSSTLAAERILAGELSLDPLAASDAQELAPLLDDARLHEFIGGEPLSEAELEARYRRLVKGAPPGSGATWLNWTIRRREDGRAVGTAQATVTGGEAVLAWVVASAWQGRGYATEAARALVAWAQGNGLEPRANIHPQHAASERVGSQAGLRPSDELAAGERIWRLPAPSDG
jgi:RimJ/RimL family protein N-acetyltransferase